MSKSASARGLLRMVSTLCAAALLVVSSVGCSSPWGAPCTELSTIKLTDYEYAIYSSTQWDNESSDRRGYTILVGKDGHYRLIEHKRMDGGALSWTSKNLFYSDENYDFRLADHASPHKRFSRKFYLQDGIATLPDNETRVGVYNGGFTDAERTDYDEQIIISSLKGSHRYRSHYQYHAVAACGNDVYGIGFVSADKNYYRVDRLVKDGKFSFHEITHEHNDHDGLEIVGVSPSCSHNHLVFLSYHSPDSEAWSKNANDPFFTHKRKNAYGRREVDSIEVIDTRTGEWRRLPLINPDKTTFLSKYFEFDYSSQCQNSLQGKSLYWLHGDGRLLKTDITTGVTVVVNDYLYKINPKKFTQAFDFWLAFSQGKATILSSQENGDNDRYYIYTIDLQSGRLLSRIELSKLGERIPKGNRITDFTVRP